MVNKRRPLSPHYSTQCQAKKQRTLASFPGGMTRWITNSCVQQNYSLMPCSALYIVRHIV